jgi:hypothetical protein
MYSATELGRHRRWSNRELEREFDRQHSRWNWRLLLGFAIVIAPIAVYVQLQNLHVELHYEMDRVQAAIGELEQRHRRLSARRAALEAPAAVEAWAAAVELERPPATDVVVARRTAGRRPALADRADRGGR